MSSVNETDLKEEMMSLQEKYDDVNGEVERLKARAETLTNELIRVRTSDTSEEKKESQFFQVPSICQAVPFQPSQVMRTLFMARPFTNLPSSPVPVVSDFSTIQLEDLQRRYEAAMSEVGILREQILSMEKELSTVTMESIRSSEIMEDQVKGYKELWKMERQGRGEAEEKVQHLSEEITSLKEFSRSMSEGSAPRTPCEENDDSKKLERETTTSNRAEELEQNIKDFSLKDENTGK